MNVSRFLYHRVYKKLFSEKNEFDLYVPPSPPGVQKLSIGDLAPRFSLLGVDGRQHDLEEFKDKRVIIIIVFTCNHCPYVKVYEDRLMVIQRDYEASGVQLIAINSNDEERYPVESLKNMIIRSRAKGFNFLYFRDEDQSVAKAYGPKRTPEVFLFDEQRRLRYHGRIDDNALEPNDVRCHNLRDAIEAVLDGKEILIKETEFIGCSIKWK